jgi:hypothetical protein
VTVVLSVICEDGVVMGADTQVTDSDRGMSYPGQKLHAMGEHAAWGGSGARSVLGDLETISPSRPARSATRPTSAGRCRSGPCLCCGTTTRTSSPTCPGSR